MGSNKVDAFISKLTTEETKDCAVAALQQLPNEIALEVVMDWIKETGMDDEVSARLDD